MEQWNGYLIFIAALGCVFFFSAVGALYWAVRHGEFKKLEKTSRQIFDEEEPEGVHTDFFPGEADKMRRKLARERKPQRKTAPAKTINPKA